MYETHNIPVSDWNVEKKDEDSIVYSHIVEYADGSSEKEYLEIYIDAYFVVYQDDNGLRNHCTGDMCGVYNF